METSNETIGDKGKVDTGKRSEVVERFWSDVDKIRIAMLVTETEEGLLRARPMITQFIDRPRTIWFASELESPKSQEIMHHRQVNLSYSSPTDDIYISISGKASVEIDKENIQRVLDSRAAPSWGGEKKSDIHLAVIGVQVEIAEFWDKTSGCMSFLEGIQDSLGLSTKESEHERIQFQK